MALCMYILLLYVEFINKEARITRCKPNGYIEPTLLYCILAFCFNYYL